MHDNLLSALLVLTCTVLITIARPVTNDYTGGYLDERGFVQNGVDVVRKIRGKSNQDINGLSPAQQFCAYHSTTGSAGLQKIQHKIQNAVLGGSLECTLVKAIGAAPP